MSAPLGAAFSTGRDSRNTTFPTSKSPERLPGTHLYVADPPPFGVGATRFNKHDTGASDGPAYHVAYRETTQPNRWNTKGWTGLDDAIKHKRGTSTGKVFSSMAAPTAAPQAGATLAPIYATHPNEMRLQELLDLQRRKLQQVPGPGSYEVTGWKPSRSHFRRQNLPQMDGPFITPEGYAVQTTRSKEIDQVLRSQKDSWLAPGDYDAPDSKDTIMKAAPAMSIGTSDRTGRTQHIKSLSVSRSIQHGIDWHVPVVVQVKPAEDDKAGSSRKSVSPPRAGGRFYGDVSPPREEPPPPGVPPKPPPAVARSVRRPLANAPGDWDWNKLGHNYRNSWTTAHGGAYVLGDRTLARRVAGQPLGSPQGLSPGEGGDPYQYQQAAGPAPPSAPEGFVEDEQHTFRSIDPASLPMNEAGDMMFPIPEENSNLYPDIGPAESPLWSPDVGASMGPIPPAPPNAFMSPPSTATAGTHPSTAAGLGLIGPMGSYPRSAPGMVSAGSAPYSPAAPGGGLLAPGVSGATPQFVGSAGTQPTSPSAAGGQGHGASPTYAYGAPGSPGGMSRASTVSISRRDLERREAAAAAVAKVQSLNARRSEWEARSATPV